MSAFDDTDSLHDEIMRMGIFERSVEHHQKLMEDHTEELKIENKKWIEDQKKLMDAEKENKSGTAKETSYLFCCKKSCNDILIQNDSEDEDEEQTSKLASRYESQHDDESSYSEGSSY